MRKNNMKRLVVLFLLSWLFALVLTGAKKKQIIPINPEYRVDTTIVRLIDITGDSNPERFELSLKASSFRVPFSWTLRILSNSDTLYSYSAKNSYEIIFGDPPTSDSSYLKLKYEYFFKKFVDLRVTRSFNAELAFKRSYEGSIYTYSKKWLEEVKHISSTQAARIAASLEKGIRQKKIPVLLHWDGNVDVCNPVAYAKELNFLVPIYSE